MRRLLVISILAVAGPALGDAPAAKPKPAPVSAPSFPLPRDASAPAAAKGGGGRIQTYLVSRGRDAVVTEVRGALKRGKWTIVKDEPSPSGNAIRLVVKHGATEIKASFTGDATRTAIILTLP